MARGIRNALCRLLGTPESAGSPRVVLLPGRAVVENHRGIYRYTETCVELRVKGGRCAVCGSGLTLIRLSCFDLAVTGEITSLTLSGED